ncbi:hypothetical protein BDV19DRAFT_357622 [Aspergillus venezuelensis]
MRFVLCCVPVIPSAALAVRPSASPSAHPQRHSCPLLSSVQTSESRSCSLLPWIASLRVPRPQSHMRCDDGIRRTWRSALLSDRGPSIW